MGGHPWFYYVDYEPDIEAALQKLRRREFLAGRYNPATDFPEFPVDENSPVIGPQHSSIEEAIEEADADGTRSILDMQEVSHTPDYGVVAPFSSEQLIKLFGTDRPTREMIEGCEELYDVLERGKGVYVIVYKDAQPYQILFAGYSFD
ncbi:MAG: hypothetical protein M3362_07945 [Acidobacteriota bacterium]|nr:hypothetical protein [Acidobacteriota bacterium]